MTYDEVFEKVKEVLEEALGVDEDALHAFDRICMPSCNPQ